MSFEDPISGQIWDTQVCLDPLCPKKYIKTCLKCVFLTKKFKEKHHYVSSPHPHLNAMIMNIKRKTLLILLRFQNLYNLVNALIKINNENPYLNVLIFQKN